LKNVDFIVNNDSPETMDDEGLVYRVRTVMENLEKSWDFKMVISRPGKVMEKT